MGKETTDYRSLACGIAWLGLTSPQAMTMASLYQSYLPTPSIKQARMLNEALAQLHEIYEPYVLHRWVFLFAPQGKMRHL